MRANLEDYRNTKTGEVECTALAEAACTHFEDFDGNDIPEEYFDIAFEAAEQTPTL
jgi:hypothetical protein